MRDLPRTVLPLCRGPSDLVIGRHAISLYDDSYEGKVRSPRYGQTRVRDTSAITTFFFAGIEDSVELHAEAPDKMRLAVASHDALARTAVEANGGVVMRLMGDGVRAKFDDPLGAIGAVLQLQQRLADPAATARHQR